MTLQGFAERYLKVRSCGGCGKRMPGEQAGDPFCSDCALRWRQAKTENCALCFREVSACTCMPALLAREGVSCLHKCVFYHPGHPTQAQNQILYRIKKFPNRRYADFLAAEMIPAMVRECSGQDALLLVPIPRSRKAYIKYGHDQAELLCRALSQRLEIPTARLFGRRWSGKEQKRLSGRDRLKNIQGVLYLKKAAEPALSGKTVLLVDDIVTTGATMTAAVRLLQRGGAKAIYCFAVAGHEL